MANVTVVGAQWGDEGKGKIVDWLSERAEIVVRFQGGHNAGHTLVIDGVTYVLESPIRADVALVYAARGDELGNLWYRRTARNFNPLMATAARTTVAEVGTLVPTGELDPVSRRTRRAS